MAAQIPRLVKSEIFIFLNNIYSIHNQFYHKLLQDYQLIYCMNFLPNIVLSYISVNNEEPYASREFADAKCSTWGTVFICGL